MNKMKQIILIALFVFSVKAVITSCISINGQDECNWTDGSVFMKQIPVFATSDDSTLQFIENNNAQFIRYQLSYELKKFPYGCVDHFAIYRSLKNYYDLTFLQTTNPYASGYYQSGTQVDEETAYAAFLDKMSDFFNNAINADIYQETLINNQADNNVINKCRQKIVDSLSSNEPLLQTGGQGFGLYFKGESFTKADGNPDDVNQDGVRDCEKNIQANLSKFNIFNKALIELNTYNSNYDAIQNSMTLLQEVILIDSLAPGQLYRSEFTKFIMEPLVAIENGQFTVFRYQYKSLQEYIKLLSDVKNDKISKRKNNQLADSPWFYEANSKGITVEIVSFEQCLLDEANLQDKYSIGSLNDTVEVIKSDYGLSIGVDDKLKTALQGDTTINLVTFGLQEGNQFVYDGCIDKFALYRRLQGQSNTNVNIDMYSYTKTNPKNSLMDYNYSKLLETFFGSFVDLDFMEYTVFDKTSRNQSRQCRIKVKELFSSDKGYQVNDLPDTILSQSTDQINSNIRITRDCLTQDADNQYKAFFLNSYLANALELFLESNLNITDTQILRTKNRYANDTFYSHAFNIPVLKKGDDITLGTKGNSQTSSFYSYLQGFLTQDKMKTYHDTLYKSVFSDATASQLTSSFDFTFMYSSLQIYTKCLQGGDSGALQHILNGNDSTKDDIYKVSTNTLEVSTSIQKIGNDIKKGLGTFSDDQTVFGQLDSIKKQVDDTSEKLVSESSTFQTNISAIKTNTDTLDGMKSSIESIGIQTAMVSSIKEKTDLIDSIVQTTNSIKGTTDSLKEVDWTEIEKNTNNIPNVQQKLDTIEQNTSNLKDAMDQKINESTQTIESSISELKQTMNQSMIELKQGMQLTTNELKETKNAINSSSTFILNNLSSIQKDLTDLHGIINELGQLKIDVQNLKNLVTQLKIQSDNHIASLKDVSSNVSNMQSSVNSMKDTNILIKDNLGSLQVSSNSLENTMDNFVQKQAQDTPSDLTNVKESNDTIKSLEISGIVIQIVGFIAQIGFVFKWIKSPLKQLDHIKVSSSLKLNDTPILGLEPKKDAQQIILDIKDMNDHEQDINNHEQDINHEQDQQTSIIIENRERTNIQ